MTAEYTNRVNTSSWQLCNQVAYLKPILRFGASLRKSSFG